MSPLEYASRAVVRRFSPRRVEALREAYFSTRGRLSPALRWLHGSFDAAGLRAHLEERVGQDFEILMVHSSVNHMKPMYTGTPLELVQMLVAYCGPQRTLVMPAFYFGDPAIGGAFATLQRTPRFDLRRTPSQMGLATELFRRFPGVLQSRHPVYRVSALGPLAAELVAGHEHAEYPAGRGTPFEFMAAHDTRIIGIGKPMQVLTQAHHVEGLLGEEFPVPSDVGEAVAMTLIDRQQEIPFKLTQRTYRGRFDIWKLRAIMDRETLREWKFHDVPMFSTTAKVVTDRLVDAARRGVTLYVRA